MVRARSVGFATFLPRLSSLRTHQFGPIPSGITFYSPERIMPSLCGFEATVVGSRNKLPSTRLPEYDIQSAPAPQSEPAAAIEAHSDRKVVTSTCHCYVPCTPNQNFRVMVSNLSGHDACITLLVDGEWIYSGLSYAPNHKTIYFSGRLIDEMTIQEMKFVDLSTTCTYSRLKKRLMR